jgi:hypothetical protein
MRTLRLDCALLLFAAGFFCVMIETAENPPLKCAGVYALSGMRLLRIDQDRFDLRTDSPVLGKKSVSGLVSDSDGITLRYFNGTAEVKINTHYAIIDGHLWIGIMRPAGEGRWHTRSTNTAIFSGDANAMPECSVLWDMNKETWNVEFQNSIHPAIAIDGITALAAGPGHILKDSKQFIAILRNDGGATRAAEVAQWKSRIADWEPRLVNLKSGSWIDMGIGSGMASLTRSLVLLPEGWRLGPADSIPKKEFGVDALQKTLGAMAKDRGPLASYEQIGDILLTPWSIDLGPVGLIPVKADAADLFGEWIGPDKKSLSIGKGYAPKDWSRLPAKVGGPSPEELEKMISPLPLAADDAGIHVQIYGWNHGMNHADHPGFIYWFLTADKKLVRMIYPAYCDGRGNEGAHKWIIDLFEKNP